MAFQITARAYRFYEDGATETSTEMAAESTAADIVEGDTPFQVRYSLQEQGGTSGNTTDDWKLMRALNGGSFGNVTATSTIVKAFPSAFVSEGAGVTQRLSSGTGSFDTGEVSETNGTVANRRITANNFSELVWSVQIVDADVTAGDTITFKLQHDIGAGFVDLHTVSVTPTLNVVSAVADISFDVGMIPIGF